MTTVCTQFSDMLACMGTSQIGPCLNPGTLIGPSLNAEQAYSWVSTVQQFQFVCGAGFYRTLNVVVHCLILHVLFSAALNNYDCIVRVFSNQNSTLQQCWTTFQASIANGNQGMACRHESICHPG